MPKPDPAPDPLQQPQPPQPTRLPLAFWGLLLLAVTIRMPGITRPLLGNFATKNVIYAMIARNWAQGRATLWYPTLDCMAGGQRSLHMLEFPASAYLSGWGWKTLGGSLDVWGRATSIVFLTGAVWLLFLLVRRRHGQTAALGAAAVLAISPVSIIYGQAFMLEASLVFFTVAAFYTADRWLRNERVWWLLLAAVCLALLLLTKIYMLVLLLPLAVMVAWPEERTEQSQRKRLSRRGLVLTVTALSMAMLPAAAWYVHAARTAAPESPLAQHVFYSVLDSAAAHRPPNPLLWSAEFYRQLFDDLVGVVLTPIGFGLVVLGFLDRQWRPYWPWLLAMLALVAALPLKFYEMNYYFMAVLPPLCILAGLGWKRIYERLQPGRTVVVSLLVLAVAISLRYAVKPAFITPQEDRAVIAAADAVRQRTGKQEPVVTMHGTTIDLLYYCDRDGWAIAPDASDLRLALDDCRRQGARLVVLAGPEVVDPTGRLSANLGRPLLQGEGFWIYAIAY